jgi:ribosomal protein L7Ae-like RNA K-turn-binding protein
VYGLLGISAKAGKIIAGMDIILENLAKKKVKLVIVAEDASEKTIKNIRYYCEKENVELIIFGNISENSKSIGKHNKAIIGILDKNLANSLQKVIHGGEEFGKN